MIETTAKYKSSLYDATSIDYEGSITLGSGEIVPITNDNLQQNTLSLKESICSGGLGIGGAIASELTLTLFLNNYKTYEFADAEIELHVTYTFDDGSTQYIPFGKYIVDNNNVKRTNTSITFTGYDYMCKLDRLADLPFLKTQVHTLATIILFNCLNSGLEMYPDREYIETHYANATREFAINKDDTQPYTRRDIVSFAAQLMGCYVRINRATGKLEVLEFANAEPDFTINESNAIKRSISDKQIKIGNIKYGDFSAESSVDGVTIEITENPFLENVDETSGFRGILLSMIFIRLKDIPFYTADVTWFGDLSVQAGDRFSYIQDGGIINRNILVMETAWKSHGNCRIDSYGDSTASTYNPVSRLTSAKHYSTPGANQAVNRKLVMCTQVQYDELATHESDSVYFVNNDGVVTIYQGDIPISGGSGGVGKWYNEDDHNAAGEIFNDYVYNKASGSSTHAEGTGTEATLFGGHAEGVGCKALGYYTHAQGYCTSITTTSGHVEGQFNMAGPQYIHIVGGGSAISPSNIFTITTTGDVNASGSFTSGGADYAELWEWQNGNTDNADRRGLFVTLDGDKIKPANADDWILGIISANPSVVGDNFQDEWCGKYLTDVFGKVITEERQVEMPDGEFITETVRKLNPDYDNSKEYITRIDRPEWDYVGNGGKLVMVDDGTCEVNGWCKPMSDGTGRATKSDTQTHYRVINRLDQNHIRVWIW